MPARELLLIMKERALIIFVKDPYSDAVKTRLATSIGQAEARRAYKLMLLHLRKLIDKLQQIDVYVFYAETVPDDTIWQENVQIRRQIHGDIGMRMADAMQRLCPQYDKVLLIGSDCPTIRDTHLEEAYDALAGADIVLGPAYDGGYYLIGMKELQKEIFDIPEWSTSRVRDLTIEKILACGLRYHEITRLMDIDTEADYMEVKRFLEASYAAELW